MADVPDIDEEVCRLLCDPRLVLYVAVLPPIERWKSGNTEEEVDAVAEEADEYVSPLLTLVVRLITDCDCDCDCDCDGVCGCDITLELGLKLAADATEDCSAKLSTVR